MDYRIASYAQLASHDSAWRKEEERKGEGGREKECVTDKKQERNR